MNNSFFESTILALGKDIFNEANKATPRFFSRAYYTEKLMQWAIADDGFRNAFLKLIDVLPVLPRDKDVAEHIEEYFTPVAKRLPWFARWGVKRLPIPFLDTIKALVMRQQIQAMARRFISGCSVEEAEKTLKNIRRKKMAFTLDLLGESVTSHEDANKHFNAYLYAIDSLHHMFHKEAEAAPLIPKHRMESSPLHISLKLSALYPRLSAIDRQKSMPVVMDRLSEILSKAKACNCFVTVDMEDYALKDYTLEIIEKVFLQKEFLDFEKIGIVLQAYLQDSEKDLYHILGWVQKRKAPITVRLVKGAYWDYETKLAKLNNWPIPVWQKKMSSDAAYEHLSRILLNNTHSVIPAFASHNIRSLCHAVNYARMEGIDPTQFELQGLYGMGDPIKAAFARRGYLVREYVPVGDLLPGMAYFVRRLLENTSNQGFLKLNFYDHESSDKLLAKPWNIG